MKSVSVVKGRGSASVNNSARELHPSRLNWFSLTAVPGYTMNSTSDLFGMSDLFRIEEHSNLNRVLSWLCRRIGCDISARYIQHQVHLDPTHPGGLGHVTMSFFLNTFIYRIMYLRQIAVVSCKPTLWIRR